MKVTFVTGLVVFAALFLVAFTPLSTLVFKKIMGVSYELFKDTLAAFRILVIMPLFGIIRTTHQRFVALRRKTYWMKIGTIVKISSMFIAAIILTRTNFITGGAV
ncbi:MAG: hypothetical protein ACLFPS_07925 [Clostridia bacterium]